MKRYTVEMPIAGRAIIEVEAENEKEAIKEAMDQIEQEHVEEWSCFEKIVEGNVCRAQLNRASATEIDED